MIGHHYGDSSPGVSAIRNFVQSRREQHYRQNLWLLFDHPKNEEPFPEFSINQGDYILIFIQRLSSLVSAARSLKQAGYYDRWPAAYYNKVVGEREHYHQLAVEAKAERMVKA